MDLRRTKKLVNSLKQPSWNHAFVSFNNQSSILISRPIPEYNRLCLLHDNRIFAFDLRKKTDEPSSSSSCTEQNILLNLLTTPKFRAMSAMYIIFRLMDNVFFLGIIVLTISNGRFTTLSKADYSVISAIGLEVFYDIMLQTNKYWILERLSIYIGLVLYCIYVGIVWYKHSHGDYSPHEFHLVELFILIRFIAFVLEESVDIAIDMELHDNLLQLQQIKDLTNLFTKAKPPSTKINDFLKEQKENVINYLSNSGKKNWPLFLRQYPNYKISENDNEEEKFVNSRTSLIIGSPKDCDVALLENPIQSFEKDLDEILKQIGEEFKEKMVYDDVDQSLDDKKRPLDGIGLKIDSNNVISRSKLIQEITTKLIESWWELRCWPNIKYINVNLVMVMPEHINYQGSFFAWNLISVFNKNVLNTKPISHRAVFILCFIPFFISCCLVFILIVLCLVAAFIPFIIFCCQRICCWRKLNWQDARSSILWREVTSF